MARISAALAVLLLAVTLIPHPADAKPRSKAKRATACVKTVADYQYATPTPAMEQLTATTLTCRTSAPWVLTIHGGSWINGTRANVQDAVDMFYGAGWQVFNMEYRRGATVTWDQQKNDVNAALNWIMARTATFGLHPDRGTVYGFSAGGHMAQFAAGHDGVSSIVSGSGVLRPQTITNGCGTGGLCDRERDMMGCYYSAAIAGSQCLANWRAFMPETRLAAGMPPVYMAMGDDDTIVPQSTPDEYAQLLAAKGIPSVAKHVPGLGHDSDVLIDGGPRAYALRQWIVAQW